MRRPIRDLLSAAVVALVLASAPTSADAQSRRYAYRADLAELAKRSEVRAGGVTWQCRDRYCVAQGRGGNVTVRGCTELARRVGRIVAYRSEIKRLADEQLAACNAQAVAVRRAEPAAAVPPPAAAAQKVAAPRGAAPAQRPRVVTEELSFTGVHAPAVAGDR
ncbi:MAG: hypothetical protein M5U08_26080 [Burkholderiales bacterium]|nr:hypothetical protein [Burkholderiales bacterium]